MVVRSGIIVIGWFAIAALTAAAAPPAPEPPRNEAAQPGDPDGVGLTRVSADDPNMNAARDRARAELPAFFERLANPAANESAFHVKFDLGDTGEFIWADELRQEGNRLTGRLANTPLHPEYRYGQRVDVPHAAIVDWGFFRAGRMQGNYTTRVQMEAMSSEEAGEIRAAFGW